MLDAHSTGKHSDAAQGMTKDDLMTRLAELVEVFQLWKNGRKLQHHLDEGGLELLEVGCCTTICIIL